MATKRAVFSVQYFAGEKSSEPLSAVERLHRIFYTGRKNKKQGVVI
jgi:hypothetical protein